MVLSFGDDTKAAWFEVSGSGAFAFLIDYAAVPKDVAPILVRHGERAHLRLAHLCQRFHRCIGRETEHIDISRGFSILRENQGFVRLH
jgi:hypothetical protein